jgi:hypothetical protein
MKYYWKGYNRERNPLSSLICDISKSGLYCLKCGTTLCADGASSAMLKTATWYHACPSCGGKAGLPIETSAVTWTLKKHRRKLFELEEMLCDEYIIENESGQLYTPIDLLTIISDSCKIELQIPNVNIPYS